MTGLFSKVAFLGQVTFLFSIFRQVTSYEGTPTELELSQGIVKGYIEPNLGIRVVQSLDSRLLWRRLKVYKLYHFIRSAVISVRQPWQGIEWYPGIPYAHPPTGNRRWKAPEALENFEDLGKGDDFQQVAYCSQWDGDTLGRTGEDCLGLASSSYSASLLARTCPRNPWSRTKGSMIDSI